MAHLLFPFIMSELHYGAQLHRNAHFYDSKILFITFQFTAGCVVIGQQETSKNYKR